MTEQDKEKTISISLADGWCRILENLDIFQNKGIMFKFNIEELHKRYTTSWEIINNAFCDFFNILNENFKYNDFEGYEKQFIRSITCKNKMMAFDLLFQMSIDVNKLNK